MNLEALGLSIALGLIVNEMCDISPFIAAKMLRWAARRIPGEGNAERYEEEWLALLQERPGKILKLVFATWMAIRSPFSMRAVYRQAAARERNVISLSTQAVSALSGAEFEALAARLARRDGFRRVRITGGAGDMGVDVIATAPDGRTIGFQCKQFSDQKRRISSALLQCMAGVRAVHPEVDEAILVTNGSFTRPAIEFAAAHRIHAVDGEVCQQWADGVVSLSELLARPSGSER